MTPPAPAGRAGFVALIGRPNVGKSTLLNRLVGERMAIVSRRPQTTRTRITGIRNLPGAQVVFVDTPGLSTGSGKLGRLMVAAADRALEDVDLVCFVAEATESAGRIDASILERLAAIRAPVYCCLNKVDLVSRGRACFRSSRRTGAAIDSPRSCRSPRSGAPTAGPCSI